MKCPICKTDLVKDGQAYLETLDEHVTGSDVSLKDRFICPNKQCSSFNELCWNNRGERYGVCKENNFIDNNDSPFGSFQRQMNVEIYKTDENKYLYEGKHWRVELYWTYTSNHDGDILKRRPHLRFWKDNVHYISGIRMLIFSIKQFHKKLKWKKEQTEIDTFLIERDWWRKWAYYYQVYYMKLFYKK